nr:DUF5703 family protein [Nocardioides yefusunii]
MKARQRANAAEWEYRSLRYERDLSRSAVTRLLVEQAELGGWELSRTRIAPDGTRSVLLRRKVIRVVRTA